jgi:hypothetical protein
MSRMTGAVLFVGSVVREGVRISQIVPPDHRSLAVWDEIERLRWSRR